MRKVSSLHIVFEYSVLRSETINSLFKILNCSGDAWRETWHESIGFDPSSHQPTVERWAHKWARSLGSPTYQEWEEKWGETYWSGGKAEKWADKWGKDGDDCWHEKWGESYNGHGMFLFVLQDGSKYLCILIDIQYYLVCNFNNHVIVTVPELKNYLMIYRRLCEVDR